MLDQETYAAAVAYANAHGGGGGGGTTNYNNLSNQPQINSVTLTGNKSSSDLGLQAEASVSGTTLVL